ncbi:MAG: P-II family nitrogen regulator [Desulfobulbaceae bacterium]|nr:P-II family nitrogen regulator [Desulfobulbaceae bacterium]
MTTSNPKLITCIVQRGKADMVVDAAMAAGAQGATICYGRGTGVRERLGLSGLFIKPEKEIIYIVTKQEESEAVLEAVVDAAHLREKGQGFAFLHELDQAIGFLAE